MKYKIEITTESKLFTDKIEIAINKLLTELDKNFHKRELKKTCFVGETIIIANFKNALKVDQDDPKQESIL